MATAQANLDKRIEILSGNLKLVLKMFHFRLGIKVDAPQNLEQICKSIHKCSLDLIEKLERFRPGHKENRILAPID